MLILFVRADGFGFGYFLPVALFGLFVGECVVGLVQQAVISFYVLLIIAYVIASDPKSSNIVTCKIN